MNRWFQRSLGYGLLAIALLTGKASATDSTTWTGWFSDFDCASARAAGGTVSATNPDCARRCIEKGVAPAFINEQTKMVYTVKDYQGVKNDLGYHVRVTGKIDEKAGTVSIQSVTRLDFQGASCARPKKTK
jgi:hypothetical protein